MILFGDKRGRHFFGVFSFWEHTFLFKEKEMGKYLEGLWNEYEDEQYKKVFIDWVTQLDIMVGKLKFTDDNLKERFRETYTEFYMEIKGREKKAFLEGFRRGCMTMLDKM